MRKGVGLNDEKRLPWLQSIHEYLKSLHQSNQSGVVACSALKQKYRHLLNSGLVYELENGPNRPPQTENLVDLGVLFVLLNCSMELILSRLEKREHDIVKTPTFLHSQFEALELPSRTNLLWDDNTTGYLSKESSCAHTNLCVFVLNIKEGERVEQVVANIINFLPQFKQFF